MIITVIDYETKKELLEIKARKNTKKIIDLIKKELEKKYSCSVRRSLVTGSINYADPEKTDIHYIMWGENLPCRMFAYYTK